MQGNTTKVLQYWQASSHLYVHVLIKIVHTSIYSVLVSPSCNTGKTAEHTATAEAEKPADGVEHDERDEGKQVRNRIAMASSTTAPIIVETEDPYTTHDNPGKEEEGNQALERTTATSTGLILIVVLTVLFLFRTQAPSNNVYGRLEQTEATEHNQPVGEVGYSRTVIMINSTCHARGEMKGMSDWQISSSCSNSMQMNYR